MNNALIGYTGFVGGNLLRQSSFAATYNSFSIQELRGKRYDEIWCAGVRAVKWWANSHPEEDWAGIAPLLDVLGGAVRSLCSDFHGGRIRSSPGRG